MRVLTLTVGDREAGSTKYRIVQYESLLRGDGVELICVGRGEIGRDTVRLAARSDLVLNQKCVFNVTLARRIIDAAPRVIFDFDDAIYTRPGRPHAWLTQQKVDRRLQLWLRRAAVVTAANGVLAAYAGRFADRVHIVPMALDLAQWRPGPRTARDHVVIGWAGAPVNLPNLERLDGVLAEILRRRPRTRLAVFSGQRPTLSCPFDYHPFVPGREVAFTQSLDIGLLPLVDEPHAHGKSPIKAIQYLACAVPVVGNVVGATAEIVTPETGVAVTTADAWIAALVRLIDDAEARRALGRAGRAHAAEHHDRQRIGADLSALLRGLARTAEPS